MALNVTLLKAPSTSRNVQRAITEINMALSILFTCLCFSRSTFSETTLPLPELGVYPQIHFNVPKSQSLQLFK